MKSNWHSPDFIGLHKSTNIRPLTKLILLLELIAVLSVEKQEIIANLTHQIASNLSYKTIQKYSSTQCCHSIQKGLYHL